MAYWEEKPDRRLARHVECFCFSTDAGEPASASPVRVVPDGNVDLLFSVEIRSAGTSPAIGRFFGTKTRPLLVPNPAPVENLAVRFRPGAAHRFLRVPAVELTDGDVDVAELWGARGEALAAALGAARSVPARRAVLERELLLRLATLDPADTAAGAVEAAVHRLVRSRGATRLRDLERELAIGERRLERLFRERVGVRPKLFARIVRFRAAFGQLSRGRPQVEVALDCGYADQAHMLREFREFAGTSPSRCFS